MATQDEFLEKVWVEIVNAGMGGAWIDATIARSQSTPDAPFADLGPILQEMLDRGVSKDAICRLARHARYEACFDMLYMLEEDPLEEGELAGAHEAILSADPSGKEGRPGSWPVKPRKTAQRRPAGADGPLLTLKKSFGLAFSPDGRLVAAAEGGAVVEVASGKEMVKCKWPANTTDVVFSPDGRTIAGINTSGVVSLMEWASGSLVWRGKQKAEGGVVTFSPDGERVTAGDWDGNVLSWDARIGKVVAATKLADCGIQDIAYGRGNVVVVAAYVPDPAGPGEMFVSCRDFNLNEELRRISLGRILGNLRLCPTDPSTVAIFGTHADLSVGPFQDKGRRVRANYRTDGVWFSPDGNLIAATHRHDDRSGFALLDRKSLKELKRVPREYPESVAFSPDGRLIGLATWGPGEVWEIETLLQT